MKPIIFHYTGDKSIINDINPILIEYNKSHINQISIGTCSSNNDILYISNILNDGSTLRINDYVYENQYIVYDINNTIRPLANYDKDYCYKKYK